MAPTLPATSYFLLKDGLRSSKKCTLFHHSGKSLSQLDYILTKSGCVFNNSVVICDMLDINKSSHVPVYNVNKSEHLSGVS